MYAKTLLTAILTLHVIAIYGPATNIPLNMPDIQVILCVYMTQLYQHKYLI